MLEKGSFSLEESERDLYKSRGVWSITLGVPRDVNGVSLIFGTKSDTLQYRRLLIDAETGELLAKELREVATP